MFTLSGCSFTDLVGHWSPSSQPFWWPGLWCILSRAAGSWPSTKSRLESGANREAHCCDQSTWVEWQNWKDHQGEWSRGGCCIAQGSWTFLSCRHSPAGRRFIFVLFDMLSIALIYLLSDSFRSAQMGCCFHLFLLSQVCTKTMSCLTTSLSLVAQSLSPWTSQRWRIRPLCCGFFGLKGHQLLKVLRSPGQAQQDP